MKDVIDVLELQGKRAKTSRIPINYRKYEDSTFMGARFIFEIGMKTNCMPQTVTTAAYIFQKFFKETSTKNYDVYLIASTSLFIASKIKEDLIKIRDVINVSHSTLHREIGSDPCQPMPVLDLSDQYWAMRDAIVQAELLISRMINFQLSFPNPQKYLLQYFSTLAGWVAPDNITNVPILQNALSFMNDFHHDNAIVNYKPEHIALASLFLSLEAYGVSVSISNEEDDDLSWIAVFDPNITRDKIWEIAERMMDCFDKEMSEHLISV